MRKAIILAVCVALCGAAAYAVPERTLANLQTAYNGESNAHARYLAFATKADEEGYAQAASLFRAAAKAEEIHAANHAVVIRQLGGTPEAKIGEVDVKSTLENLKTALAGEVYERDVMYPDFIKAARAEKATSAVKTFNYALNAEAGHAQLYTDAGKNLPNMKKAGVTYNVCSVCGYTVQKVDFSRCPKCGSLKDKFVQVS